MGVRDHWHEVEKRPTRAVHITRDFIKALIDEPSGHIVPRFDGKTGQPIGISATTPNNSEPLTVEMHDWLLVHPSGDIERMDGYRLGDTYSIRD